MKRQPNGKTYLYLTDFEMAINIQDKERIEEEGRIHGTAEYLPPEILNSRSEKPNINRQDVWAIGVTAYKLCTFQLPFITEFTSATVHAIINSPHAPIEMDYS